LGQAKEVIQVGAVLGSEFSYELLREIHPIAEEHLQRALRALADAELLYVRGIAPEATYPQAQTGRAPSARFISPTG
jgi:hypothetical protein